MNTYILWNHSTYDTLEQALSEGAGKVIRLETAIPLSELQDLIHDVTEYCCHSVMQVSEVKGLVARALGNPRKEGGE